MALSSPVTILALPWLFMTHPMGPPEATRRGDIVHSIPNVVGHRDAMSEISSPRRALIAQEGDVASTRASYTRSARRRSGETPRVRQVSVASCEIESSHVSASDKVSREAKIERILVLGDSHAMGYFGRVLHNRLGKRFGADVTLVGACGKSEPGFLYGSYAKCGVLIRTSRNRTRYPLGCRQNPCKEKHGSKCSKRQCRPKKLTTYLRTLEPDVIILQLGANSTWMGNAKDGWPQVRANIRKVVQQIKAAGARCVWVTAPDTMIRSAETQDKFAALYEDELQGHCEVFNSRPTHRPYMHYSKVVREMKLSSKKHDMMHYWWFGKRGRRIQTRWATDIIDFTASHFGPDSQLMAHASVLGKRQAAVVGLLRHERRAVATQGGLSTQSANVFPRKPEVERRRTRDNEAALTDARDESAQYQR